MLGALVAACTPPTMQSPNPSPSSSQTENKNLPENYQSARCIEQFHAQTPPVLKAKNPHNVYRICHNDFAVLYSGETRTPLWVAEKLTKERLSQSLKREDSFKEYPYNIPEQHQAKLNDYKSSGYDRGHMAPNADMGNLASQSDSFYLTNMVPQTPENNQHDWREIEEAVRKLVKTINRDTYVVTGPAFINNKNNPEKFIPCDKIDRNDKTEQVAKQCTQAAKNRIQVPTHTYKAVYFTSPNGTPFISAYWLENDRVPEVKVISICELEKKIGVNLFPQLDDQTKRMVYDLPLTAADVGKAPPKALKPYAAKASCLTTTTAAQQIEQNYFK